jgi:hypothetical protein
VSIDILRYLVCSKPGRGGVCRRYFIIMRVRSLRCRRYCRPLWTTFRYLLLISKYYIKLKHFGTIFITVYWIRILPFTTKSENISVWNNSRILLRFCGVKSIDGAKPKQLHHNFIKNNEWNMIKILRFSTGKQSKNLIFC